MSRTIELRRLLPLRQFTIQNKARKQFTKARDRQHCIPKEILGKERLRGTRNDWEDATSSRKKHRKEGSGRKKKIGTNVLLACSSIEKWKS